MYTYILEHVDNFRLFRKKKTVSASGTWEKHPAMFLQESRGSAMFFVFHGHSLSRLQSLALDLFNFRSSQWLPNLELLQSELAIE